MLSHRLAHHFLGLIALVTLLSCSSVPPLTVDTGVILRQTYDFTAADKPDQEYALYVPTSYDPRKKTPLVVLLHGLTSNPQQVMGYQGIAEQAEKYGMIVVAPFGYNEGGWYGSLGPGNDFGSETLNRYTEGTPENLGELSEQDIFNVLDITRKSFNIDSDRIYLAGHSMGGGGTFYLATKYPNKWAALAPMAPAVLARSPKELEKIKAIPVIVVQGDQDRLVPVEGTRRWVDTMDDLRMTYKYIEIAGGDHTLSISRNPEVMAEVFEFLHQHER